MTDANEGGGDKAENAPKFPKRRTVEDDHGFAKKMRKCNLELSSFTDMEETVLTNCGVFAVHDATFYPKGTKENLDKELFNAVLIDNSGTHALFSAFGEDAQKWSTLKAPNVIEVDAFGWKKDISGKSKLYNSAVTADNIGQLHKGSSFTINKDLSVVYSKVLFEEQNHVFTLEEVLKSPDRFVVIFKQILNENQFHKEGQIGRVRSLLFNTADGRSLTVTFFNERVDKLDSLIENDTFETYCIENAKYHKNIRHYHDADFYYQTSTHFVEVTVKAPAPILAISTTLADVYLLDDEDKSTFKVKAFLSCNPVAHGSNIHEANVYDGSHAEEKTLLGIIRYDDNIDLEKGNEVEFEFHISKQGNRKLLNVVPGSMKKIDPADMEKPKLSLIHMLYI